MNKELNVYSRNLVDIRDLDKNAFFHYTNINNLDSILKTGLKAKIGDNSGGIELMKKYFLL